MERNEHEATLGLYSADFGHLRGAADLLGPPAHWKGR
jgi:hypothetical protein